MKILSGVFSPSMRCCAVPPTCPPGRHFALAGCCTIAVLEAELGVALFDRENRAYRLNEHGRRLMAYAERMEAGSLALMIKLFAYDSADKSRLRAAIENRREFLKARLAHYEILLGSGEGQPLGGMPISQYLSIKRGQMGSKDWNNWCDEALGLMENEMAGCQIQIASPR